MNSAPSLPAIQFTVEVDDRGIREHLDRLPMEVRAKLLPTIRSLTERLLVAVRDAEPMKTGRLRAATRSHVDEGETYIRGHVSIGPRAGTSGHNVAAAALEYGVHSSFTVRSHDMRMSKIFGRAALGGELVMVNAYTRRVSISARRFLRDPFERLRPIAEAEIKRVLSEKLEP